MSRRLNQFINQNRRIIIIAAAVLLLLPIGYFVYQQVTSKIAGDAAKSVFDLDDKYGKISLETDPEKKKMLEADVLILADSIVGSYSGMYASQKALEVRITLNQEKLSRPETTNKDELIKSIVTDAIKIATGPQSSFMTPKYLVFAAAFIENIPSLAGTEASPVKFEEILPLVPETFTIVNDKKAASFADIAYGLYSYCSRQHAQSIYILEALFNAGRLAEARKDIPQAISYYEQLERDYSNNNWTNMAINRRIALQPGEKKE